MIIMKIGFNSNLEKRMDDWIAKNGGMPKLEKDLDYLFSRLEKEKLYDLKSKMRRPRRQQENGQT